MFFKSKKISSVPPPEIHGVRVKPSSRARRLSLRIDARAGDVVLVFPKGASEGKARRFIERHEDWIERQRARAAPGKIVAPGMTLRVCGRDYIVEHKPGRGVQHVAGDKIIVRGGAEHFARRLKDFLKTEAAKVLAEIAREKSAEIGLKTASIRILDPKTRWGSCGVDGRMMFSWRLILAPPEVMDYVVAH